MVRQRRVGRTGLFGVDPADALTKALKVARTIRRVQIALRPALEMIDLAVLFGSAARGEERVGSDVDVFVVASDVAGVLDVLARHQWMQPIVRTSEEHMRLLAESGTFVREVERGIVLWEQS